MVSIARSFSTTAPPASSFRDDKPSLIVSWWCTLYTLVIIGFRIMGRYIRTKKMYLDDKIMISAIIPLLARMCFETAVVTHGTNNVDTTYLTEAQIDSRELGSKMVLVSRILYVLYLWTIKYSLSIFLKTLTAPIWTRLHQVHLGYLHFFLFFTLMITFFAILAPCQPFNHFWQVVPDPGPHCRQNYIQIFTTGSLNVLTNLVLVVFPIPMVLMSGLPFSQKFTILLRLSLPLLPVVLTLYAVVNLTSGGPSSRSQVRRTLLISVDMLLTAFSANAAVLFSLLQDKGYKKSKFKLMRELFNTNRPTIISRPSYRSGSFREERPELCDAGNLVQGFTRSGGIDSDSDRGLGRFKYEPKTHDEICHEDTKYNLQISKQTTSLSIVHGLEQEIVENSRSMIDLRQTQTDIKDDITDRVMRITRQENQISHPSPVYLGIT